MADSMGGMSGIATDLEQGLTAPTCWVTRGPRWTSPAAATRWPMRSRTSSASRPPSVDNGSLEVEAARRPGIDLSKISAPAGRGHRRDLPPATPAAIGVGFDTAWLAQIIEQLHGLHRRQR